MNRPGIQPAQGIAALRLPAALSGRVPGRPTRVAALIGVVLVLSLADLLLTLIYVLEIGLIEDNPVARTVMQTGGPGLLVAWKLLSVGLTAGILLRFRRHGIAEFAAIFCAAVMIWLTTRWVGYIETSAQLTEALEHMDHHGQGHWVTLAEPDTGT